MKRIALFCLLAIMSAGCATMETDTNRTEIGENQRAQQREPAYWAPLKARLRDQIIQRGTFYYLGW